MYTEQAFYQHEINAISGRLYSTKCNKLFKPIFQPNVYDVYMYLYDLYL